MDEDLINQIKKLLGLDYFALFGLTPGFNINQNELKFKYLELQKQFHPDNFIQNNISGNIKQNELNLLIVQLSAQINSAYTNLKNPLSRGVFLLKQNGIDLDFSKDTNLPEKFLFQQMEFRDNIEHAKVSGNLVALETIESELLQLENNLILDISNLFFDKDYLNARELLKQLAFYNKLLQEVNNSM